MGPGDRQYPRTGLSPGEERCCVGDDRALTRGARPASFGRPEVEATRPRFGGGFARGPSDPMLRTRVRAGTTAGLVLSLIFAGLFTVIGTFDLYVPSLAPRLGTTAKVTLRIP